MISIICPSNKYRWIFKLNSRLIMSCPTRIVIIIKIIKVWSWKKISCSIMGDALSWRRRVFHVAISKKSLNFIFGV